MTTSWNTTLLAGALALLPIAATTAHAATLIVPVAGIASYGLQGSAGNVVKTYLLGANATITGVSYDLSMTAIGASFLSEMSLILSNSDITDGVFVAPGYGQNEPGLATYSGSDNLIDTGGTFNLNPDGILRLEFFDAFNDYEGVDGYYTAGTYSFEYTTPGSPSVVPEPATWALMIAGFGMVGATMRRRKPALAA